jgi:hypothetical protein
VLKGLISTKTVGLQVMRYELSHTHGKISGYHSGVVEDSSRLQYDAVSLGK